MISLCRPFVTVRCIDNDVFLAKNMNIIFTVYRYCRATSHYSSFSPPFVARCFFSSTVTTWPDFGSRPPLTGLHDHTLDTPHSVGLLWTSDRPVVETSTWQHTALSTDRHTHTPAGFEPTMPANERPQTHALDCAATGTSLQNVTKFKQFSFERPVFFWRHSSVFLTHRAAE